MNSDERIDRLERALLAYIALATGQINFEASPDEVAALQQRLGEDLTAMAKGL
jgi:hypothetical protein